MRELLSYDPESGIFKWRIDRSSTVLAGDAAGCVYPDGYRRIIVDGRAYLAHRLVWVYVHGYMPENDIDHKNRRKDDNRLDNLKEVTKLCNARNTKIRSDNMSGVKGISFDSHHGKWKAQIGLNGNNLFLGLYSNFDNAVCARYAGEQCLEWAIADKMTPARQYVEETIIKCHR